MVVAGYLRGLPIKIKGVKRRKVTTVTQGPFHCSNGPCDLSVSKKVEICNDAYVEISNGVANGVTATYKNGLGSASATFVNSSSNLKGKGTRVCQSEAVSVVCTGKWGQSISLNHITHQDRFKSKVKVKGVRLKRKCIGHIPSNSNKMDFL